MVGIAGAMGGALPGRASVGAGCSYGRASIPECAPARTGSGWRGGASPGVGG
ncbi:unnamed protein product, partial [Pylaiella littoralis]